MIGVKCLPQIAGQYEAGDHCLHGAAMSSSSYRELERDVAHLKAAISLLEQTRAYFAVRSPVKDPAYRKARLRTALASAECDDVIAAQIERLLGRLALLRVDVDGDSGCGRRTRTRSSRLSS
ncbi:hypothetical protein BCAR13_400008 [Paraburkholderia caribensis]|nr:hypothetical protein BCAR13_400008 [Paraburkholderia caribensis]